MIDKIFQRDFLNPTQIYFLPQDDVLDKIYVVFTTSRGLQKNIQTIESTKDVSREVEVKIQFWSPEQNGN